MRFFSRKKQPTQIGSELSERLTKSIATIPDALSSLVKEPNLLRDVDIKRITKELAILTFVGQRLAIQQSSVRTKHERETILNVFDSYGVSYFDNSTEFLDLIDKRGEQYFQLFHSHRDEINNGDRTKFFDDLGFKFDQFCHGGGDDVLIIGSIMSDLPLRVLAMHYWVESFSQTIKYLVENK